MKFIYSTGQRVLDGYTIKRGIGQGGFGEVYYALSDGGKEVALKLVRGQNLDVELRGMAQCMNLKHPNLLSLFDLRTDVHGDNWVVMEYISGEPLSGVINRHPEGLPTDLVQQWFLTLTKAVGYLHDQGIVHRDLKPGNIFLENGTVKVGDYGLCKFISSSQRTAQTQSIGTVHYMAPEISTGNYNKQIDIYAAGVVLYEMLTGRVPFDGESAGEILMKHLTSPPDLTKLPPAYIPVVHKALAKNPAQRFASMAEMAQALEAIGQPTHRPAVADRGQRNSVRPGSPMPNVAAGNPAAGEPILNVLPAVSFRGQVGELCGALALSAVLSALFMTIWARIGGVHDLTEIGSSFFLTVAACWAVLIPSKFWTDRYGDSGLRRTVMMVLGVGIGMTAVWLEGWSMDSWSLENVRSAKYANPLPVQVLQENAGIPAVAGYLSYFGLGFFAIRWWKMADRHRRHRFSLAPVLAAGFWALLLLVIWPDFYSPRGAVALILTSIIVQWVSPWESPPPPTVKRMRLRYA